MAPSSSTIILVVISVLDIIAFGLAIGAEQRRSTVTTQPDAEKNYTYCVYSPDVATGLGAGAFTLLALSQVAVTVASRCFCCSSGLRPGGSRAFALILFLLSWLTFAIAEICLLAGSVENAYHTQYRTVFFLNTPDCAVVRKGTFAAGAAFVFFTGIATELYYVFFNKARLHGVGVPYNKEEFAIGMT